LKFEDSLELELEIPRIQINFTFRGDGYPALMRWRAFCGWLQPVHKWPELAPGQPRHSERARAGIDPRPDALSGHDGEPVTIFSTVQARRQSA